MGNDENVMTLSDVRAANRTVLMDRLILAAEVRPDSCFSDRIQKLESGELMGEDSKD